MMKHLLASDYKKCAGRMVWDIRWNWLEVLAMIWRILSGEFQWRMFLHLVHFPTFGNATHLECIRGCRALFEH